MTEREHAAQWDDSTGQMYTEGSAAALEDVIDDLITLYFPDGPPNYSVDAGDDMITWSGEPVLLDPVIVNNSPETLTYAWSVDPVDGVSFSATNVEAPTVTITKPSGDPAAFTLELTIGDGVNSTVRDSMTIDVYDTACLAARIGKGLAADYPTDIDGNCITGLRDFVEMAKKWLVDNSLTAPVPK